MPPEHGKTSPPVNSDDTQDWRLITTAAAAVTPPPSESTAQDRNGRVRLRTKKAGHTLAAAEPIQPDWVYKLGRRDLRARGDDGRFRLTVVAPTVADVVSCVGGWLVDRAMLGWDITVLIAQPQQDLRPLNILGVRSFAFDAVLKARMRLPIRDGMSVAADLYFGDTRVRRYVVRRVHQWQSEFTLWGQDRLANSADDQTTTMSAVTIEHRLSGAARKFKAHALCAALGSWPAGVVGATETFCDGWPRNGLHQRSLRVVQNDIADTAHPSSPP
jgi:hypothetical protein